MYFLVNGIHSDTLVDSVMDIRVPILPDIQDHREQIPGKDGLYLFPQPFGNKKIEIDCVIQYDSVEERAERYKALSKLFTREEVPIVTSREPNVYYIGKIAERIEPPQEYPRFCKFTIVFECQSFTTALEMIEHTFTETTEIESEGTAYSEFKLSFTPSTTVSNVKFIFRAGSYVAELLYENTVTAGQTLVIDTENFEALIGETNVSIDLKGEFPVIMPGINEIEIVSSANYEAVIEYRERFM